jgi:ribosomal protein S18 acetylase RimI-like enzyme
MEDRVLIRELELGDLPGVALVHMLAFPGGGLMMLGAEVMRRYYEWQLIGPHEACALGAFMGKELAGFCFGGVYNGAMSGFLSRNKGYLAVLVLTHPWLLTNPIFRERLGRVRGILKRGRASVKKAPDKSAESTASPPQRTYRIQVIAVSPQYQGRGLGKRLLIESERVAIERGYEEMGLCVHVDNSQAIGCYESLRWERAVNDANWDGQMRKRLRRGQ